LTRPGMCNPSSSNIPGDRLGTAANGFLLNL